MLPLNAVLVLLLSAAPEASSDSTGEEASSEHEAFATESSVRVRLEVEEKWASLYDVTALAKICRAPCGVSLLTDETRRYRIDVPGFPSSTEFTLPVAAGEALVRFTPRKDGLRALGLGLTLLGGLGAVGVIFGVGANVCIALLGALFGSGPVWQREFLTESLISGAVATLLIPGLILLLSRGLGRERLEVIAGFPEARPAVERRDEVESRPAEQTTEVEVNDLFEAQRALIRERARLEQEAPTSRLPVGLLVGAGGALLGGGALFLYGHFSPGGFQTSPGALALAIVAAAVSVTGGVFGSVAMDKYLRARAPYVQRLAEIDAELIHLGAEVGLRSPRRD